MPLLLRQVTHKRWQLDLESECQWLAEGEIPADPVTELKTTENCLSVWEIGDDTSLIGRIAAALTIQRKHLQRFDYVLFDSSIVADAGIEIQRVAGETVDEDLNRWHINLKDLSAQRLLRLVETILETCVPAQLDRVNPKVVGGYIVEGVSAGRLMPTAISDDIKMKLGQYFREEWRRLTTGGED